MSLTDPTPEEALQLFQSMESSFPSKTLGDDKWYILALACITGGGHSEFAANLYQYLISKPEFSTPQQRQALMKRLREALMKLVSVVGVPKPLEAIFQIAGVEREEDRDYSFSRQNWQNGPENLKRGMDWLSQIYRQNHTGTVSIRPHDPRTRRDRARGAQRDYDTESSA